MALRELVSTDDNTRLDHYKVWTHVAFLAMTAGFLKILWQATPSEASALLFLVYGSVVGGSSAANKFLSVRFGNGNGSGKKEN